MSCRLQQVALQPTFLAEDLGPVFQTLTEILFLRGLAMLETNKKQPARDTLVGQEPKIAWCRLECFQNQGLVEPRSNKPKRRSLLRLAVRLGNRLSATGDLWHATSLSPLRTALSTSIATRLTTSRQML